MISEQPLVQSFVDVHTALRNDLATRTRAIQAKQTLSRPDVERLHKWFEFYLKQLSSHHNGEDTYFYPAIGNYDQAFLPGIAQMQAEHHELDHVADDIKASYSKINSLPDGPERNRQIRRYGELFSTLGEVLDKHLTNEENLLFPSIANHIPINEQKTLDDGYLKKLPMKDLTTTAPWLLANISPEQLQEIRKNAPWIMRVLYDWSWKKKYEALAASFQLN